MIQYGNSRVGAVFEAILKDTLKRSKASLFLQNLHEAYPINTHVVGSTCRELNIKYGPQAKRKAPLWMFFNQCYQCTTAKNRAVEQRILTASHHLTVEQLQRSQQSSTQTAMMSPQHPEVVLPGLSWQYQSQQELTTLSMPNALAYSYYRDLFFSTEQHLIHSCSSSTHSNNDCAHYFTPVLCWKPLILNISHIFELSESTYTRLQSHSTARLRTEF